MAGNEGRMVGMRDSTVFRDLAHHLEREATRLRGLGYAGWAVRLSEDAAYLLEHAKCLAHAEPPQTGIGSLAGIDPEFRSAESESELERLRQREVSCRECGEAVECGDVVFHEECLDPAIIAARAALKQGENESG